MEQNIWFLTVLQTFGSFDCIHTVIHIMYYKYIQLHPHYKISFHPDKPGSIQTEYCMTPQREIQ